MPESAFTGRTSNVHGRRAFTLLQLMMVVVVIGALYQLLLEQRYQNKIAQSLLPKYKVEMNREVIKDPYAVNGANSANRSGDAPGR